jgi:hypothetical protein
MATANLHQTAAQRNRPEINGRNQPPEANPTAREGSIVFTLGLSGSTSTQIVAEDSATEKRLRDVLKAVRPQLESLRETVTSLGCEPVSGRS